MSFFSREAIENKTRIKFDLDEGGPFCLKCGLFAKCNSPRMKYTGEGRKKTLIIAEAPGADEDKLGIQLVGKAGRRLKLELLDKDLRLNVDFWKTNAVNCRPHIGSENRTPTAKEIQYCKPIVDMTILETNPNNIWLMGGVPIDSMYANRFKRRTVNTWRGFNIPDQKLMKWISIFYHPSYLERTKGKQPEIEMIFEKDLERAISYIGKPVPNYSHYKDSVTVLTNIDDILSLLKRVLEEKPKFLAFDYETTGLRPFINGHRIVSISFCFNEKESFSFPWQYANHFSPADQREIHKLWRKILATPRIKKIAHNIPFEYMWSKVIAKVNTQGNYWCTQLGAHILDNRSNITGLKIQTYLNFGIDDYSKDVEPFIRGGEFNNIDDAPLKKLLFYGGFDSLFTYWLFLKQRKEVEERNLQIPINFFTKAAINLSKVQMNGICVDEEYYKKETEKAERREKHLTDSLMNSKEAEMFRDLYGKLPKLDSNIDISKIIYELLGHESEQQTESGKKAVNAEVLREVGNKFTTQLLQKRRISKVRGTYLSQFLREVRNGKLNPFFGLAIATSFRGNCFNPNFQNIPVRDEYTKKICRSGILPSKGNELLECDFSGIEVTISACYNKDPNLINYITDESTDMHRDTASDIWRLPTGEVHKKVRFYAKNCMVFPQFYGDYYASCAKALWKNGQNLETKSGIPLMEHAESVGIGNYEAFEKHVKECERIMWEERFPVYDQWRNDIYEEYLKNGYISTYLGFQYVGPMDKKQVCNYPIQGTAFHILLWTLINLQEFLEVNKMRTKIIGQIHDSIILDGVPEERGTVLTQLIYLAEQATSEEFDWINVPLKMDVEVCPIDSPWTEKKEIPVDKYRNLSVSPSTDIYTPSVSTLTL